MAQIINPFQRLGAWPAAAANSRLQPALLNWQRSGPLRQRLATEPEEAYPKTPLLKAQVTQQATR